jgi:DegV family protein with EDD domain
MNVRVVTDSTCDLSQSLVEELDIIVVPLYVNIGDLGFLDGLDLSREQFYSDLPNMATHPTTATPGIHAFKSAYGKALNEGAEAILSIHISESLSATVNVARQAAAEFSSIPVIIIDSRQLSMGTGFQVELAARQAIQGFSAEEILAELTDLERRTFVTAKLATLEYLKRSGRMNPFITGLASMLRIIPILTMKEGTPGSERIRTASKASARMLDMLEAYRPFERIALLHSNAIEEVKTLASRIPDLSTIPKPELANITPVIGAHVGPGAVGFAVVKSK